MGALKTFIIYSSKDKIYREELESHLQILMDESLVELWSDKQILPGEEWDAVIKRNLQEADLILMLVSIDFFNSSYIRNEEFKIALQRKQEGKSMIVPIIVRPCLWNRMPVIRDIQVLPAGGQPVADEDVWKNRDKAWHHVVEKLSEMIESRHSKEAGPIGPAAGKQPAAPSPEIGRPSAPPATAYRIVPNPVREKIPLPKGIYSIFAVSPEGDGLYVAKHRTIIEHAHHYDLHYYNFGTGDFKWLANLGTDNYYATFFQDRFLTTTTVEKYTTRRILGFEKDRNVPTAYDGLIIRHFSTGHGMLFFQNENRTYCYLDEFGKLRKAGFLAGYQSIKLVHRSRPLLIASRKNTDIVSNYKEEYYAPNHYSLLEFDANMEVRREQTILSESNTVKYGNFSQWDDHTLLFLEMTDENRDGKVDHTEKDNARIRALNLETLEVSTVLAKKFSIQALAGLPNGQVFFVDETAEDSLYMAYILDPGTNKLSASFEFSQGHYLGFQFTRDFKTMFFKKVVKSDTKDTFYDWENDSEIYRMKFAE